MTTSTPEQKRDAWVSLMAGLDLTLITTREHAKTSRKMAEVIKADTGTCPGIPAEEWDATAWAAQQLLKALQSLRAPEVPVDHAKGQEAIPLPSPEDVVASFSTPGDNPGDGRLESQEEMLARLRPACICPPEICLEECPPCSALDPELPCLGEGDF